MPENPLPYQHRGELYRQKGDLQKALEQLTKALELAPESIATLLVRAGVYYEMKQPDKALEDIDAAIKLQPTLAQPHLMRAEILAATNRLDQAIAQLEKLLQTSPGNVPLLNRLGTFLSDRRAGRAKRSKRRRKSCRKDPDNFAALRFRADAYLNIGKHAEAIADFDKALALKEDDESLLNNFAWVLATSPDDKLRDGPRALKMATKAAEATGYETPHILSTLAAAYAETGDFENAAKWSQKAVELSQKEVDCGQSRTTTRPSCRPTTISSKRSSTATTSTSRSANAKRPKTRPRQPPPTDARHSAAAAPADGRFLTESAGTCEASPIADVARCRLSAAERPRTSLLHFFHVAQELRLEHLHVAAEDALEIGHPLRRPDSR